jgi:cell division protease FtsH
MIFGQKDELVFLGREIGEQRDYSEAVAEEIDEEVRRIVSEAYEQARQILIERRDKLELVAETLLEVETLEREEFLQLMGEESEPETGSEPPQVPTPAKPRDQRGDATDTPPALDMPPSPAPA